MDAYVAEGIDPSGPTTGRGPQQVWLVPHSLETKGID